MRQVKIEGPRIQDELESLVAESKLRKLAEASKEPGATFRSELTSAQMLTAWVKTATEVLVRVAHRPRMTKTDKAVASRLVDSQSMQVLIKCLYKLNHKGVNHADEDLQGGHADGRVRDVPGRDSEVGGPDPGVAQDLP